MKNANRFFSDWTSIAALLRLPVPTQRRDGFIGLAMAALVLILGGIPREQFALLVSCYFLFFGLYVLAYHWSGPGSFSFYLRLGLWLRLLLLFATPALSDDFYRFIWDGRLWLAGYHPLAQTPIQFLEAGHGQAGLDWAFSTKLNSLIYHTVYPPVTQIIFVLSCLIPLRGEWLSTVIMRGFTIAAEAGNLWLLPRILSRLNMPAKRSLLYALNPLIILEITGNLHHEGIMIFFLLWSFSEWQQGRLWRSATGFALAIATKLLPLLFIPFMIKRLHWRANFKYWSWVGLLSIILFAPLLGGTLIGHHFGESLNLYFQQFTFNGSLFKVATWIAHARTGYFQANVIGPTLGLCAGFLIVCIALWEKDTSLRSLPAQWLAAILVYLAFGAIVHPWYASLPLVLCLFTRWRFPIVWSGLAILSYIHYSYEPRHDNNVLVALEYGLTFIFFAAESLLFSNAASKS